MLIAVRGSGLRVLRFNGLLVFRVLRFASLSSVFCLCVDICGLGFRLVLSR